MPWMSASNLVKCSSRQLNYILRQQAKGIRTYRKPSEQQVESSKLASKYSKYFTEYGTSVSISNFSISFLFDELRLHGKRLYVFEKKHLKYEGEKPDILDHKLFSEASRQISLYTGLLIYKFQQTQKDIILKKADFIIGENANKLITLSTDIEVIQPIVHIILDNGEAIENVYYKLYLDNEFDVLQFYLTKLRASTDWHRSLNFDDKYKGKGPDSHIIAKGWKGFK